VTRTVGVLVAVGSSVLLCSYAFGQQPATATPPAAQSSVPEEARDKLAQDLANLQSQIQAAQQLAETEQAQKQKLANVSPWKLLGSKFVEITRDNSLLLSGADPSSRVETSINKGATIPVLDKSKDYYAVALPSGQTGWVASADVKPMYGNFKLGDTGKFIAYDPKTSQTWGEYPAYIEGWDVFANPYLVAGEQPSAPQSASNQKSLSISERVYKTMTDAAVSFRDSYKNNPYFQVTGFTVVIGVPPALNLDFSFK
jgi:Bacterial SH3 domain